MARNRLGNFFVPKIERAWRSLSVANMGSAVPLT